MKHVLLITLLFTIVLTVVPSANAQASASDTAPGRMKTMELKADQKNNKQAIKDTAAEKRDAMKASESAMGKKRVNVMNADLTAISGTTLTITKDGKTMTVTTNTSTKFKRHYGGITTLAEFTVGNKVDVSGMWSDTAGTTIAASTVRNRSIMKRRGVFLGDIVSKTGNTIIIKTKGRGDQTITVSPTTKYVDRSNKVLTLTDVVVGHKILVKGMWDKTNNTVTQVTQLKDFTLPLKASVSAQPTIPGASPSATTNL